jgi:hypothetical protein
MALNYRRGALKVLDQDHVNMFDERWNRDRDAAAGGGTLMIVARCIVPRVALRLLRDYLSTTNKHA